LPREQELKVHSLDQESIVPDTDEFYLFEVDCNRPAQVRARFTHGGVGPRAVRAVSPKFYGHLAA